MLVIALLGMSYVFNACTDPVAEMEDSFAINHVVAVEEDGDSGEQDNGPITQ